MHGSTRAAVYCIAVRSQSSAAVVQWPSLSVYYTLDCPPQHLRCHFPLPYKIVSHGNRLSGACVRACVRSTNTVRDRSCTATCTDAGMLTNTVSYYYTLTLKSFVPML